MKSLSHPQRDLLIRHIDAEVPFVATDLSTRVLLSRGLIRPSVPGLAKNPRGTVLTTLGRETACAVLALYAEALISAGYEVSPLGRLGQQATESVEIIDPIPQNRHKTDLEVIDNLLQEALDNAIERRNNRVAGGASAPLEKGPEHENRKIPL